MSYYAFIAFIALSSGPCIAPDAFPCPLEQTPEHVPWKGQVRVQTLKNLDDFLNWSLRDTPRTYALSEPLAIETYTDTPSILKQFSELHGFFSLYYPLVGKVTVNQRDVEIVRCLLANMDHKISDDELKQFATNEVIAKVLAYRDLRIGDRLEIGLQEYRVDAVFNLWLGMPAFGLVPEADAEPILLFRGTDFTLHSPRGWASLMSDVDMAGPGLHAFQKAQPQIHAWLAQVAETHSKARVIGYSLGGALAAYAYIFENELISDESYAFNLPGIADQVIQQWNSLPEEKKQGFTSFVNRGDVVSKVGKLFGRVVELSTDTPMKPLTAHTMLISAQSVFYQRTVDVPLENASRIRDQNR